MGKNKPVSPSQKKRAKEVDKLKKQKQLEYERAKKQHQKEVEKHRKEKQLDKYREKGFSKKKALEQIKKNKQRYEHTKQLQKEKYDLLIKGGIDPKEASKLKTKSWQKVQLKVSQNTKEKGDLYLVVGVKDVTESGEWQGYINEVFKTGKKMSHRELRESILDALENPEMNGVGAIGKGIFYIANGQAEEKKYMNFLVAQGSNLVYHGRGLQLHSLETAINIAMSLFYYTDERDQFILDFINNLRQLDNSTALFNADVLENEFFKTTK